MMSVDLTDHTWCDLTHQSSVIYELRERRTFQRFVPNLQCDISTSWKLIQHMLGIPFSQDPSPFILFQLVLFSKPLDFGLLQIKTFFFWIMVIYLSLEKMSVP